jgi:tetratricopeptide (TPR) repeat protein
VSARAWGAMCYTLAGASMLAASGAGSASAQAQPYDAEREMKGARQLLEAGAYRDAEVVYGTAVTRLSGTASALRAAAYFGRAFATQQRLTADGDTAGLRVAADGILAGYELARSLNPVGLEVAATNNMALVFRAIGRHAEAARHFRQAGASSHAERASFLANAGKEYERIGMADSADWAYSQALAADTAHTDALRFLLDLRVRVAPAESVVAVAERFRDDSTGAKVVIDALRGLLNRDAPAVSDRAAAAALVSLAWSVPVARVGAGYFGLVIREPLQRAAAARPALRPGIEALVDAFAPRARSQMYEEPASAAAWWHADTDARPPQSRRRAAWSSVLRWIGDTYNQAGDVAIARSYYEAAIGGRQRYLDARWMDRRALLPLALIYAEQDRESGNRLEGEVNQFTQMLFDAKGEAYRAGDVERIRDFHMTLGALYVARGRWTGPDARNAVFQLEHMRKASETLRRQTGKQVEDPPHLLEKLAVGYHRAGRTRDADRVTRDVEEGLRRRGRTEEATVVRARIQREVARPSRENATPGVPPSNSTQPGGAGDRRLPLTPTPPRTAPRRPTTDRSVGGTDAITGRLVDAATGLPIPLAKVAAYLDGGSRPISTAPNADGIFRVPLGTANPANVRLRVEARGYKPVERRARPGEDVQLRLEPERRP